jgi:serine/threonine protein kinase
VTQPVAPVVPGYEMLDMLGQGGFGIVYRARQLAVSREVALKIDNRVLVSERDRWRFMREVTAAGALSGHPHVAHVYDAGVLPDGRPFMVMELCPGGSLADRLKQGGLRVAEVRTIGVNIADALAAAHAAGVLHRDVKPANILVNRYENVVLADFGLATMPVPGGEVSVTRESLTPAYAPPEAFELTEPTATGDVYSLAATLYALLSGRPPRFPEHGIVNIAAIMALHRQPIPDIPGVPAPLTAVLRHGMATRPEHRLPSAVALRDALAAVDLDAPPADAPAADAPPGPGYGPPPRTAPGGRPGYSPGPPPPHAPGPALHGPALHGPAARGAAMPRPADLAPLGPGGPLRQVPTVPGPPPPEPSGVPAGVFVAVAAVFVVLLLTGTALLMYGS